MSVEHRYLQNSAPEEQHVCKSETASPLFLIHTEGKLCFEIC